LEVLEVPMTGHNVDNTNLESLLSHHKEEEIRIALRALRQLRYFEDFDDNTLFCSSKDIPGTEPYFSHLQNVNLKTCNLCDIIGRFPFKEKDGDDEENKLINRMFKDQVYFFEIGFTLSRYNLTVHVTSGFPGLLAGGSATYNFDFKRNDDFVFTGKTIEVMF